jgi:hypothetical protein
MGLRSRPLQSGGQDWVIPKFVNWILKPLNGDGFERGCAFTHPERVKQVLELLVQIDAIARALRNKDQSADSDFWVISEFTNRLDLIMHKESGKLARLGKRKIRALNRVLSHYRWSPRMGIGRGYYFQRNNDIRETSAASNKECRAIDWLLHDAELGHLYRYKVCPECKKWFYTITDHQRFCSDSCRKRYASHSTEYKGKRREYMKKYRRDQKARDSATLVFARNG